MEETSTPPIDTVDLIHAPQIMPVTKANTKNIDVSVSFNFPKNEPKDNMNTELKNRPSELKRKELERSDEIIDTKSSVKRPKTEPTTKELIGKLKSEGKLELISNWINEFLLQEDGGIVERDCESFFAIRVLDHIRKKWTTTQKEQGTEEEQEPLPLAAAKHISETILFKICNNRAKIYCCGLCNLQKCFSFGPLFHHISSQHRNTKNWKNMMKTHNGEPAISWPFALWPEYLPIRGKPIIRTRLEESEALMNHMRETVWKINRFRAMPSTYRLALWFCISLDWYNRRLGSTLPSYEIFSQCADYILEDTENSIFTGLQCGVCGIATNKNGNLLKWNDLRRHFEDAHTRVGVGGTWMEKMVVLPEERKVSTFGKEILDENFRNEWLELWRRVDERRETLGPLDNAEVTGGVMRGVDRIPGSPQLSDTNPRSCSRNISQRPYLMLAKQKGKGQGKKHSLPDVQKQRYTPTITKNEDEIILEE